MFIPMKVKVFTGRIRDNDYNKAKWKSKPEPTTSALQVHVMGSSRLQIGKFLEWSKAFMWKSGKSCTVMNVKLCSLVLYLIYIK